MNNFVTQGDTGISQAWILATMGRSKQTYRRIPKRDLNVISIPEVCEEVSNLASEARHLRLTSNLLYGLSLMYKQKVAYMASDLTLICDRLTAPLFTSQVVSNIQINSNHEKSIGRRVSYKADDQRFDINADFILDFPDSGDECNTQSSLQKALTIKDQDRITCGNYEATEIPGYALADAQEKSFFEYINKSMIAKEISLEDCLKVDFEFNQDGEIIGQGATGDGIETNEILADFNLEEDFNVISGSIEDISKSGNLTVNDPIHLDHNRAIIYKTELSGPRKRRKIRPKVDEVVTTNFSPGIIEEPLSGVPNPNSVADILHELSLKQPPFLNMCYRIIFGASATASMSTLQFPSSSRHPNTTNLDSFLKEIDDIERGRNISSRRPSSSIFDDVVNGSPFPITGEEPPGAFNLEPLSPLLDETDETDSGDASRETSRRLESFRDFLTERAEHIAANKVHNIEENAFTLESLIPSKPSSVEQAVTRSLAANAISCLLQLACSGEIILSTTEPANYNLCKSVDIYIVFQ